MNRVLPWSLRQTLARELRATVIRHRDSPAMAKLLATAVGYVANDHRSQDLRRLVESGVDGESLEAWFTTRLPEMPQTQRGDWLVEQVAEAGGWRWQTLQADLGGPIRLPSRNRDHVAKRLARAAHKHPGEFEALADALHLELGRLGKHHDALALRVTQRRFCIRGRKDLTWREALRLEGATDPDAALRALGKLFDLEWR